MAHANLAQPRVCKHPFERPKVPQAFYQISYSIQIVLDLYDEVTHLLSFETQAQQTIDYLISGPLTQDRLVELQEAQTLQEAKLHTIGNHIQELFISLQEIRQILDTLATNDLIIRPKANQTIESILTDQINFLLKVQKLIPDMLADYKVKTSEILSWSTPFKISTRKSEAIRLQQNAQSKPDKIIAELDNLQISLTSLRNRLYHNRGQDFRADKPQAN